MPKKRAVKSETAAKIAAPEFISMEPRIARIYLRAAGFLLAALCVWGWSAPDARLWGFHFFAFLPEAISIPLFTLAIVFLLPAGEKLIAKLESAFSFLRRKSVWLWFVLSIVCLFGLRVSEPLLGDGRLWIRELSWIGEFAQQGTAIPEDRTFKRKEPLSLLLHEAVFTLVTELSPAPRATYGISGAQAQIERETRLDHFREIATQVYRWLSILAGALSIVVLVRFARSQIPPENRAVFFSILLACGGWLLFFGYVENYSWSSLFVFLTLTNAMTESLPPRKFPWKTALSFAIAVGFHYSSIILAPAVFYLLTQLHFQEHDETAESMKKFQLRTKLLAVGMIAVFLAGYVYEEAWEGWISVIPLLPRWSKDGYAMFSLAHIQDLLNLLPFLCGLCLAVWMVTCKKLAKSRAVLLQSEFMIFAAATSLLFVCVFNPNLGMARDWDLLAASAWPVILLGAWRASQVHWTASRQTVISIACGVFLLTTASYVAVNALYDPSIARFKTLLAMDRSRSAYGWENLALHYQRRGEIENRIDAWQHAIEAERNPRYVFNYADALKLAGRSVEATPFYLEAARENLEYSVQLLYLAATLGGKGNFDLASAVMDSASMLRPDDENVPRLKQWILDAKRVKGLMSDEEWADADAAAREAQRKDPNNSYWKEQLAEIEKHLK